MREDEVCANCEGPLPQDDEQVIGTETARPYCCEDCARECDDWDEDEDV